MTNTKLVVNNLQNRIRLLATRDPVANKRIINKLMRRLRKLEG